MSILWLKDTYQKATRNSQKSQGTMNSCKIRLKLESPEMVLKALTPEIGKYKNKRSTIRLGVEGKELVVEVEAKDVNGMRAAINNVLRLVLVCQNIMEIE